MLAVLQIFWTSWNVIDFTCYAHVVKLVIVESPTKAKTLTRLLGSEYTIKASNGHVRDLPKKELGVDLEDDFLPKYVIPPKNRKRITELKNAVKKCKTVVLATDPDREGEAIAWHVSQVIKKDSKMPKNLKFERVVFHEITKSALKEAFEKPEKLNDDLVDAQQARRVLDRLVGYNLSPLLWKKVRYGLSAGRVQSVAVRLIVERERERDAFKPEEYWSVEGEFETKNKDKFNAKLEKQNGKKIDLTTKKRTDSIVKDLDNDKFKVDKVTKSSKKRSAPTPFKTSTLQQNASNLFGFSASRTMRAAQKLFERGYITYHRTDSFSLAPSFVKSVRSFVKSQLGSQYLPEKAKVYKTKSKSAQEAHEAIRPTNIKTQLSQMEEKGFSSDEIKLYSLILKRSVECQTKDAMFDRTSIHILSDKKYEFKANG